MTAHWTVTVRCHWLQAKTKCYWGLQQLCKSCRTCFKFYCMFYFTCDRSFTSGPVPKCLVAEVSAPWLCSFRLWRFTHHLLTYLLTQCRSYCTTLATVVWYKYRIVRWPLTPAGAPMTFHHIYSVNERACVWGCDTVTRESVSAYWIRGNDLICIHNLFYHVVTQSLFYLLTPLFSLMLFRSH